MAPYLQADELTTRLVAAALRCIARWGVAKTSLDDIAREAGVGRATVYRAVPGGKDRLLQLVLRHEIGRLYHEIDTELAAADDLADLLTRGLARALSVVDHPALGYLAQHEPELVLPHFAFHRLDRVLAATTELCRPHLARFLPDDAVAPAADWVARIVVTYAMHRSSALDPHDITSIRRLVRSYLLPALTPHPSPLPSPQEQP